MNRDERIEKAREFWIAEMDRVGPDWDTAEVMENYATDREAVLVAALEAYADRDSWGEYIIGKDCRLIWHGDENEGCFIAQQALKEYRGEQINAEKN